MSRMSIRTFLSNAKHSLSQSLSSKGEHPASFVIGNDSADLDSITCALVYSYIQSNTTEARNSGRCIIPVTNILASGLRLRTELTALLKYADLKPTDLVTLDDLGKIEDVLPPEKTEWTLVDHNALQGTLGKHYSDRVTGVIDHHDDEGKVAIDAEPRIIEKTGSCGSHVVNYCHDAWEGVSRETATSGAAQSQSEHHSSWDAQLARLALGSILIDTFNLESEDKTTEHDRKAVEYLEAKINASPEVDASYDRDAFFKEINDAKSNLDQLSLDDILRKDYKQWTEGDMTLGISSVVQPIQYLQAKDGDFVPTLLDFAKERELDLFAVGTSHNASGTFERQLLLLTNKDGKSVEVAKKFAETCTEELQLEASDTTTDDKKAVWLRLWEQKNLKASRKRVGPLLRKAMR